MTSDICLPFVIRSRLLVVAWLALSPLCFASQRVLVWLIPSENVGPTEVATAESVRARVQKFSERWSNKHISVLNALDPLAQMAATWNPAFTVPNFAVVEAQRGTLAALERFARERGIRVDVRFVTWDEAFGLLTTPLPPTSGPDQLPDIAQIGTTWAAYFALRNLIVPVGPGAPGHRWQDINALRGGSKKIIVMRDAALPFTTDVRLLFYWRRLPGRTAPAPPLEIKDGATWPEVFEAVRRFGSTADSIVFPTGNTLNLLHDYAPLIWGGNGKLLTSTWWGPKFDFTSDSALRLPRFLAIHSIISETSGNGVAQPRRLATYPESTHEEADKSFVNLGYRATVEPAHFIDRWRQDFVKRFPRLVFLNYAAAAVPANGFRGGSDLVILRSTHDPGNAAALANFLTTDEDFSQVLAQAGHLPSGSRSGVKYLLTSLRAAGSQADVERFGHTLDGALAPDSPKYPDLEEWPQVLENPRALEQLQIIWRRIAQADAPGVQQAATKLETTLNEQIYPPARFRVFLWTIRSVLFIVGVLIVSAIIYFTFQRAKQRSETNRQRSYRTLAILAFRAFQHDILGRFAANLDDVVCADESGNAHPPAIIQRLQWLRDLYKVDLIPHVRAVSSGLTAELQGASGPADLSQIVQMAQKGAIHLLRAQLGAECVIAPFVIADMHGLTIPQYPFHALIILREWFVNSLKYADQCAVQCAGDLPPDCTIQVSPHLNGVTVISKGTLSPDQLRELTSRNGQTPLRTNPRGLEIIRTVSSNALGAPPSVTLKQCQIEIWFPFHIERKGHLKHGT